MDWNWKPHPKQLEFLNSGPRVLYQGGLPSSTVRSNLWKMLRRVMETNELQERYDNIKAYGFIIDVRGVRPLLIKGARATSYDTFQQALAAAETEVATLPYDKDE